MKSKAKWYLLLGLGVLLASLVGSCASEPSEPPVSYPALTTEQVISYVQVYGVPTIKIYGNPANPVGQWSAVYEGDGKWRVGGAVVGSYEGENYYHSTLWIFTHEKIELTLIDGRPPEEIPPTSWPPTEEEIKAFGKK